MTRKIQMSAVNLIVWSGIIMTATGVVLPLHAQKYQILLTFRDQGSHPSGLARDAAGNLYGTTSTYGVSGFGTVFKLDARTRIVSVLHVFADTPDGASPKAGVTVDPAGNVYGTTLGGGLDGQGTIFRIDPSGVETILHSFSLGMDGNNPTASLIRDPAGDLYGTTAGGGRGSEGTVFRIDASGMGRLLYQFDGLNGSQPYGSLARDSAGNLYGTTVIGGDYNHGTVFQLAQDGTETVLHSFTGGVDGDGPYAEPALDSAGNLYGTTAGGGDFNQGTVFKIDTSGNFTVLHSFNGINGSGLLGGLVLDATGNLYGTTRIGGRFNLGVLFKLTPAGNEIVLHSFAGRENGDGSYPDATLLLSPRGTVFGTTRMGCIHDAGSIFTLEP